MTGDVTQEWVGVSTEVLIRLTNQSPVGVCQPLMKPTDLSVGTLICVEIDKRGSFWAGKGPFDPVRRLMSKL